jgi:hypothetical protein
MTVARYTFLPWLRRGIANQIQSGAGPLASRASLVVELKAMSERGSLPLPAVPVKLVGPGDIGGLNPQQIVRTEPRPSVTDFEPNYLAAIDLYDEDFPWRYSPLAPDPATHRLVPWIALIVLKDDEFTRSTQAGRTSSVITLTAKARRVDIFPVPGQEHAWAHVHLNESLGSGTSPDLDALHRKLDANPDLGYARLLCPRKLDPDTGYTAFLVPVFEVGRKAGLGEAVADTDDGLLRSWVGPANDFPVYHEWRFRTGVDGDFEALVRALVPRDMDPRVGVRDLSIATPGYGVPTASNPPDDRVGLEGALLAPTTVRRGLAAGSNFVPQVRAVLNAPADARDAGASGPGGPVGADDPIVAPPIHGSWLAAVERVGSGGTGWVDTLNLDPRHRAAAGLGARVVRSNQERYMRLAWDQIGDVVRVNHTIRRAQLASKAAATAHARTLLELPTASATAIAAPTFARVMGSPVTLRALVRASRLPRAALSPALRKHLRPRGPTARRLVPPDARQQVLGRVIGGLNDGTLSAAPPPPAPGGATLEGTDAVRPLQAWQRWVLDFQWLVLLLLLLLALLLAAFAPLLVVPLLVVPLALAAMAVAWVLQGALRAADPDRAVNGLLAPAGLSPQAIVDRPAQPGFVFTGADAQGTLPPSTVPPGGPPPATPGDNAAARDLRRALTEFHTELAVRVQPPAPRPALDLRGVHRKAMAALEPHRAFAERFAPLLQVGGVDVLGFARNRYLRPPRPGNAIPEVMNHPDIKDPMFQPLAEISDEYFVPNLSLIPNNTISLMQTNQQFIESYMVGLNHEFARELLWREYPTDQRGSVFRQFWDVSNYVDCEGRDPKTLAEALKDIPRIHGWGAATPLGSHNQRDAQGDSTQVVLVIRGDLLKRYPNTFVYAQRATWGSGARANRLVLSDETGELYVNNPKDERLRFPLYRARIAPDIHFIGFDLTLADVKGDPRLAETAQARAVVGADTGWFFVLQEIVGEPRFGLDVAAPTEPAASRWDNLSWMHVDLGAGQSIDVAKAFVSAVPGADGGIVWGANAADMASILYQKPVMVGIHGRDMLKQLNPVT